MYNMQGRLIDFFELLDVYIDDKIDCALTGLILKDNTDEKLKIEEHREKIKEFIKGEHIIRFEE